MPPQYIYSMKDLGKVHPPNKQVLKGIWLSFYYGAKIGVLGLNGAGKSSLLRIMAGVDQEYLGEARLTEGMTVGFLPQEPQLTEGKTVLEIVEEGVASTKALLDRFNEISARFAEPMEPDEMEKLLDEQARVQEQIDHKNAWELDRQLEIAMDALRCPPADRWSTSSPAASGGGWPSAASCCSTPTCCCSTNRPITWTPNRWPGSSIFSRPTPARWWPSPTTVTSSTTWPAGSWSSTGVRGFPGRGTTAPGSTRRGPAWPRRRRPSRPGRRPSSTSWSGSACRRGPARPRARPASPPTSSCWPSSRKSGPRRWRSPFRRGRGSATWWWKPRTSSRDTATGC